MTEREEGRAYQAAKTPNTASPCESPFGDGSVLAWPGTEVPQGLPNYPHGRKRITATPRERKDTWVGKACPVSLGTENTETRGARDAGPTSLALLKAFPYSYWMKSSSLAWNLRSFASGPNCLPSSISSPA